MSSWVVPGYTEIRPFAQGAAGHVVLAWHDTTGTPVVIRYLGDPAQVDPEILRRVRTDARLMSEVDNPNVIRLYEYVESPAGAAIVMELVDGVSLRALLREYGPAEPELALALLKGALTGLTAGHARGVLHRDLRPESILVDTEGRVRVTDFALTSRGAAEYLAPEQWTGAPPSVATDIYAATATFYECLVGAPPPGTEPPGPVPGPLGPLLARGLARDPGDRPGSATAFLVELAAAAAAYGPDWEDRGHEELGRRASGPTLLPGPSTGPSTAPTTAPTTAPSTAPSITLSTTPSTGPGPSAGAPPGPDIGTRPPGPVPFIPAGPLTGFGLGLGIAAPPPPAPAPRPRWRSRMLVGAATALTVVVGVASCLAMRSEHSPGPAAAASTPDATPETPSSSPSGAADVPQVTPMTSLAAEPSPPRATPTRRPTPASTQTVTGGLQVTGVRIDTLRISTTGRTPTIRVTVTITTTTADPFELTLHHEGSADQTLGGLDTLSPTDSSFPMAGAVTYTQTFNLPLSKRECNEGRYLLVSAVTAPGAANGPQLAVVDDPGC